MYIVQECFVESVISTAATTRFADVFVLLDVAGPRELPTSATNVSMVYLILYMLSYKDKKSKVRNKRRCRINLKVYLHNMWVINNEIRMKCRWSLEMMI